MLYPNGKTWHYVVKWRGSVRKGDTKCESVKAAEQWLRDEKAKWAHEEHHKANPLPTLRKIYQAWAKIQKGQVSDLHLVNMRCAVETHAKAFLDQPIDRLTNAAVMEIRSTYLNSTGKGYRQGQTWTSTRSHSEGGANSVVKLLSALCGWAVEAELIQERPFRIKKLKPQPKPEGVVWPENVRAFIAEADRGGKQHIAKDPKNRAKQSREIPHSAVAIRLMIGLGLREDEALGSRWEWLDRRRKVYTVGEAKDRQLREIPVPDWLMSFLELRRGDRESGLILPSEKLDPNGDPLPHHKNFTQKPIARIAEKLEIASLTPHRLRATFATAHYEAGTTPNQIQQMLGHEDPSTTMGYIIQRPKDQAIAQQNVATLMGMERPQGDHRVTLLKRFKVQLKSFQQK